MVKGGSREVGVHQHQGWRRESRHRSARWVPEPLGREQGRRGTLAPRPMEGEWTLERMAGTTAIGERAGMSGCTSTGASGGRVDTRAHGEPGTRAIGEGAWAPAAETLATVGGGTVAETPTTGGTAACRAGDGPRVGGGSGEVQRDRGRA